MKRFQYDGPSREKPTAYLSELIFYIEKIEKFTTGLSFDEFLSDEVKVYAVDALIRNVGEAVRVLAKHRQIKSLFYTYRVPYESLADLRTSFTHEYFSVDSRLLWETATNVLPKLKPQFRKVLGELDQKKLG